MMGVLRMHQSTIVFPDEDWHTAAYGYVPAGRLNVTAEPVAEPFDPEVQVVS